MKKTAILRVCFQVKGVIINQREHHAIVVDAVAAKHLPGDNGPEQFEDFVKVFDVFIHGYIHASVLARSWRKSRSVIYL